MTAISPIYSTSKMTSRGRSSVRCKVTLSDAEKSRIAGGGTRNVEAHDLFLKGRELMFGLKKDREIFDRWMACFRRAIELDPNYSDAYAGLSMGYSLDHQNRWSDKPELSLGEAERFADMAIAKDDKNPFAHLVASMAAMSKKDYRRWADESERALSLNPNYAPANLARGILYIYTGNRRRPIPYIERAMRLDPTVPAQYLHFLGTAYFVAGDYETAAKMFKDRITANPHTDLSRAFLASTLGHLGRAEEARRVWQELKEINPRYSLEDHMDRLPFKDPADAERIVEGVRKAGLRIAERRLSATRRHDDGRPRRTRSDACKGRIVWLHRPDIRDDGRRCRHSAEHETCPHDFRRNGCGCPTGFGDV